MGRRMRWILAALTAGALLFIIVVYRPLLESMRPPAGEESLPVPDEEALRLRLRVERAEQSARTLAAELRQADSAIVALGRPQLAYLISNWLRARAAADGEAPADSLLAVRADSLALVWLE